MVIGLLKAVGVYCSHYQARVVTAVVQQRNRARLGLNFELQGAYSWQQNHWPKLQPCFVQRRTAGSTDNSIRNKFELSILGYIRSAFC